MYYIPYWENTFNDTIDSMHAVAVRIVGAKKFVFTKILDKSEWPDTTLVKGDLVEEVMKLKSQPGKDMVV